MKNGYIYVCNEKSNDRELDRKKVGQIRQYEQYNRQRHRNGRTSRTK